MFASNESNLKISDYSFMFSKNNPDPLIKEETKQLDVFCRAFPYEKFQQLYK